MFTGERVKSRRERNRSRKVKLWRYVACRWPSLRSRARRQLAPRPWGLLFVPIVLVHGCASSSGPGGGSHGQGKYEVILAWLPTYIPDGSLYWDLEAPPDPLERSPAVDSIFPPQADTGWGGIFLLAGSQCGSAAGLIPFRPRSPVPQSTPSGPPGRFPAGSRAAPRRSGARRRLA